MTTRMLDLYALHPDAVPPEYATLDMIDRHGHRLAVGSIVDLPDLGECRIIRRRGAWIDLDQDGDPAIAFVTELSEGVRCG